MTLEEEKPLESGVYSSLTAYISSYAEVIRRKVSHSLWVGNYQVIQVIDKKKEDCNMQRLLPYLLEERALVLPQEHESDLGL